MSPVLQLSLSSLHLQAVDATLNTPFPNKFIQSARSSGMIGHSLQSNYFHNSLRSKQLLSFFFVGGGQQRRPDEEEGTNP